MGERTFLFLLENSVLRQQLDYKEEQQTELDVLQSIYIDEFERGSFFYDASSLWCDAH